MSVPNQRKIIIERSSDKAKADFFKVSNDSLNIAMFNLKDNAFKLWIYFADNKDGYIMDLYPVDFCSKANVSYSTYKRSFEKLEHFGYLVKSEKNENYYLFKEMSESENIQHPDMVNSLDTESFKSLKETLF